MSNWLQLLDRMLQGLAEFERRGTAVPDWILGGGTALMILADHRLSKDIDAFIDDPQHLALLSPDVTDVWNCSAWDKAANYLKLRYPEGEIDFIVTAPISTLCSLEQTIDLGVAPVVIRLDDGLRGSAEFRRPPSMPINSSATELPLRSRPSPLNSPSRRHEFRRAR